MHWPLFLSLTFFWLDFPIEIHLFQVNRNIMCVCDYS